MVSGYGGSRERSSDLASRAESLRALRVSHAFHSRLLEPMLAEFAEVAETLSYNEARIPMALAADGRMASPDAAYWVRQVRDTVRFGDVVTALTAEGIGRWLELGPDGTLSALARGVLGEDVTVVPMLRKNRDETTTTLPPSPISTSRAWTYPGVSCSVKDRSPRFLPTPSSASATGQR